MALGVDTLEMTGLQQSPDMFVLGMENPGLPLSPVTITEQDLIALFNVGGELGFVSRDRQVSELGGSAAQKPGKPAVGTSTADFTPGDQAWLESVGINPGTPDTKTPKSKDKNDPTSTIPFGEYEAGDNLKYLSPNEAVQARRDKLRGDDLAVALNGASADTQYMGEAAAGQVVIDAGGLRRDVAELGQERKADKQAAAPVGLTGLSGIAVEDTDSIGPAISTPAAAMMAAQEAKAKRNAEWAAANPDKVKGKKPDK